MSHAFLNIFEIRQFFLARYVRLLLPYVLYRDFVRHPYTPEPFNPRPAGVWLVTRPAGGGGGGKGPPEISQTTGPISKLQMSFNSPVRELPVQGQKFDLEVTDDVTGQVKVKKSTSRHESAMPIHADSACHADSVCHADSAWIVSLTSLSIISCAL